MRSRGLPTVCLVLVCSCAKPAEDAGKDKQGDDTSAQAEDPAQGDGQTDEPAPEDLLRELAQTLQGTDPEAMMGLLQQPKDVLGACKGAHPWDDDDDVVEFDEETMSLIRTRLHMCVPPGDIESIEYDGRPVESCEGEVTRWVLGALKVRTAGGTAVVDDLAVVVASNGARGWWVTTPFPTPPGCYSFIAGIDRVGIQAPHEFPPGVGTATLGMSIEELRAAWGESTNSGEVRCRVNTAEAVDWRTRGVFGQYATRWDAEANVCVMARFDEAGENVESYFFDLDRDDSVRAHLVEQWGEPTFDGLVFPDGEPVPDSGPGRRSAFRRLTWTTKRKKVRATLDERTLRKHDFYRLEFTKTPK